MNEIVTERIPLGDLDASRADALAKELDRKPSDLEFIRKAFVAEQKGTDDEERSSIEVISNGSVDRDNEILLPKGATLTHYRKNPVVLWAHLYKEPPIGKAAWVKYVKPVGDLLAKTLYAATDFANEICGLVLGGFLPARSVGFIPIESHEPDEKEIAKHPERAGVKRVYDKWELLEYSIVPVPSNRQALQMAVGKDIILSKELQVQLGLDDTGENLQLEEIETKQAKQQTELISLPSQVKEVLCVPKVRRVIFVPKKELDIRQQVARVVTEEIDRQRGRV